jgi:hypothetical protein
VRWAAHHFCPVRRQSLDVLRMLTGMAERMAELGVGEAAGVVRLGEREKGSVAAGELEQ